MILKKSSPIKHGKLIAMVVTLMTAMTFALIYQDTQSPPHEDDYVVGVFSDNSQNHSEIESRYELLRNSILDTSDEESVRNSIDWFFQNSHQEIAVLLSSEVLRYKGHGQQDADGARTIQTNEMNMFNDDPCPQWPRFMGRIDSLEDVKKLIDGYDCGVAYADQLTGQIFDKLKELGIYEDTHAEKLVGQKTCLA